MGCEAYMKKVVSFFVIILLSIDSLRFITFAMSQKQQDFYQAAIVDLNVNKVLILLQQDEIDLNDMIEIDGEKTTFLHEIFRELNLLIGLKKKNKDEFSNEEPFLIPDNIGTNQSLNYEKLYKEYENNMINDSTNSAMQILQLFLGFGANVDFKDSTGISVRDLVKSSYLIQEADPIFNLINNFPSSENSEYENCKKVILKRVINSINREKYAIAFFVFILMFLSTLFFV